MKKSDQYHEAMKSVIRDSNRTLDEKLEILETLMCDKNGALYSERLDAEKAAKEAAQA